MEGSTFVFVVLHKLLACAWADLTVSLDMSKWVGSI